MTETSPPPLKPGDTIGVRAPPSRVANEDLQTATGALTTRGYKVFIHPQCHETDRQSAGTTAQKIAALHDLALNPDIKAVFFAVGGNRALHMLDGIDYSILKKNPKIYMGFSDNTALLNAITAKTGIVTYHGPVFKRIPVTPQADFDLAVLEGREKSIPLDNLAILREGRARGTLFGGNLSLIRAMKNSDLPKGEGSILFLEDIREEYSKVDRELCALRRDGLFDRLGGIIFGQFSAMQDTGSTPFGFTLEDIIREHTEELNIPVFMTSSFGHEIHTNYVMPIGAQAEIDSSIPFVNLI